MNHTESIVANPGIVRPPLVYLLAVLLGVLMDQAMPMKLPIEHMAKPGAGLILILAIVVFIFSRKQFQLADTPIPGNKEVTSLITSGPFQFSRNPIYVSFSLAQISVALLFQTGWVLFTLVLPLIVMSCVVIPREEKYMARKFGSEYVAYQSAVRRWL